MTGKHFFEQYFYVFAVKVGVHNLSVGVVPFCHSEPTSINDAQIAYTNRARPLEWQTRINLAQLFSDQRDQKSLGISCFLLSKRCFFAPLSKERHLKPVSADASEGEDLR